MKLNIGNRLVLLGILPKEGNFVTLRIVRKLQEDLSFSEDELEKYKIVQSENKVNWDSKIDSKDQKDIDIGGEATVIIVKALKDLDKSEKLLPNHVPLYEKFIGSD